MRHFFLFTILFTALSAGFSSAGLAAVFYWRDQPTQYSVVYPDRWHVMHNQKPDDIFTIAAPGENDHAGCRIRVRDDRRFMMFPRRYDAQIQRLHYSRDFWERYVAEFREPVLHSVKDNAAMSIGFATHADVSYITTAGPKVEKRGLMFASLYNGKAYILECSAEKHAFPKYARLFGSILKSVEIRPLRNAQVTGYYRDFLQDDPLLIHNARDVDLFVY